MAVDINIDKLATAIVAYARINRKVISNRFAQATEVEINKWCKTVTKIQGEYHIYDSIISHVVQGFKPEWQPLGEWHAKDKGLKSYRQKINFPITPAKVLGTALAELYVENEAPEYKDITKVIIDDLLAKVDDDLDLLSFIGEYNAATASGVFGYSLDGWNTIVRNLLGNTARPCYKIPLNALTATNLVDQFTQFELKLPKILKGKIKEIHVSSHILELYSIDYRNTFGQMQDYKEADSLKSPLGKRVLVGHDNQDDDIVFCTVAGNMYRLVDLIENPAKITDVQKQDYTIKIFADFELGYDFGINEAVVVANFANGDEGLGDKDLMELYYPRDAA